MECKTIFTKTEEALFYGPTWATETMTALQRLRFYRDTGEWPGVHSLEATEIFMQSDINQERAQGKDFCANQKLQRAMEAGLDIK